MPVTVASVLFCYAVPGLFFGAFAASGPAFLVISELKTGSYGLLLFLMTVGALPAMTLIGNRIYRAPTLALPGCLAAFAVAAVLLGQAEGVTGLALGFLAVGAASGALDVALNTRVSAVEADTGAVLFNRAHAVFPLAVLVAGPVAGVARDGGIGPGTIFGILAVLMGLAAAIELRVGSRPGSAPDLEGEPVAVAGAVLGPALLCLGAIATCGAFLEMAAQGWAVIFVESAFGASATASGFAITAFMLGLAVGRLVAHALDARLTGIATVRLGAVIAVPAFGLIAAAPAAGVALTGLFLAGAAVGPIEPSVYRQVSMRHAPARRGRALSRVTAITYVGYLSSSVVLGPIAQAAGWSALWATAAVVALAATLLTVLLARLDARVSG